MSSVRIIETIDSTTAELLRLPLDQAPVGTALLALVQTGGRGRSDRVWESPFGGMYFSAVLPTSADPRGFSLLGAKAVLRLLDTYRLRASLRWPNDVMVEGKKIAGVLPVSRYQGNQIERAVLGVGLNVAQPLEAFEPSLRRHVTTLATLCPDRGWDVSEVARQYLTALEAELAMFQRDGLAQLCRRCEPFLEGAGQDRDPLLVEPDLPARPLARIVGLAPDGALLLYGGDRLESLGRDQRLRFVDEL